MLTSDYTKIINKLSRINNKVLNLIDCSKVISELPDPGFSDWKLICDKSNIQLKKKIVRIAVVGTIKSGKSTFVNSLFGGDYLKRGAGVLTSIVTRVRNSKQNKAILFFKNWMEINHEIRQSLIFIPSINELFKKNEFDIKQKKDRHNLELALNNLGQEQLITNNAQNINVIKLLSYLRGYKKIYKYINAINIKLLLKKEKFLLHQNFTANDELAIYLNDILLEIEGSKLNSNIEIGDCQGSDSPNPIHMLMIQNYLNTAHFVIYIISSRIGLRQADIKFLLMIKKMGLLSNILFVINTDLNEHHSFDDLKRVILSVKKDLKLVCQSSLQIFSFSALLNLINTMDNGINENQIYIKDDIILEKLKFSILEYKQFRKIFEAKVNHDRYFLLTNNHLQKLSMISNNIENWVKFNQNILTKDTNTAQKMLADMVVSRSELINIQKNLRGSINGVIEKVKKEIFFNIECFFGDRHDGLTKEAVELILRFYFNLETLSNSKNTNLTKNMDIVFQKFKQTIENYILETISPKVIRFVQEQEVKLVDSLKTLSMPYFSIFKNELEKHHLIHLKFNPNLKQEYTDINVVLPSHLDLLKNRIRIEPLIFDVTKHSSSLKSKVLFQFNWNKIKQKLLRIFLKQSIKKSPESIVIEKTIAYIKKRTKESVIFHLKNYKENIKFQHISYFANMIGKDLEQQISTYSSINTMKLNELKKIIELGTKNRTNLLKTLENINKKSVIINEKIKKITEVIKAQTIRYSK